MLDYLLNFSPTDIMPLDRAVYLRMFERMNGELWPLHVLLIPWILCLPYMLRRRHDVAAAGLIASLWLFVGVKFHATYLAELSWFAVYFAYAFYFQAVLWTVFGMTAWKKRDQSRQVGQVTYYAGWVLVLSSLLLIPLVSVINADSWKIVEWPGIAPTPTVLLTMGMILLQSNSAWWLIPVPLLWVFISVFLSHAMGQFTGYILLTGAIVFIAALLHRRSYRDQWGQDQWGQSH